MSTPDPIGAAEHVLYPVVASCMDAYLEAARDGLAGRAVTAAPSFDLWPGPGLWPRLIAERVAPVLRAVWDRAWAAVTDRAVSAGARASFTEPALAQASDSRWPADLYARAVNAAAKAAGQGRDAEAAVAAVLAPAQSEADARRIARTLATGAVNSATQAAHGPGWDQTWRARADERTRATHRRADGQQVPVGEPFTVGTASLAYPGDPTGPASETVNCRCDLTYTIHTGTTTAAGGTIMDESTREAWDGPLLEIEDATEDGRIFADLGADVIPTRPLPASLNYQKHKAAGHDGAFNVGTLEKVWREGNTVYGSGYVDTGSPEGIEAARKLREGFAGWISVDLADFDIVEDADGHTRYTYWKLDGATLLPGGQAVATARIHLSDNPADAEFATTATETEPGEEVEGEPEALAADAGALDELFCADQETLLHPPAEWFEYDRALFASLDPSPHVKVTDDGRVYGYVGAWHSAHLNGSGRTMPRSRTGYSVFQAGQYVVTNSGKEVEVGVITAGCDHAPLAQQREAAMGHYADSGYGVALVVCKEDPRGLAVMGQIVPGATRKQVADLRARELSGDWRPVPENYDGELCGILTVNSGGFAKARTNVDGYVLVASLGPAPVTADGGCTSCGCGNTEGAGDATEPAPPVEAPPSEPEPAEAEAAIETATPDLAALAARIACEAATFDLSRA